MEEEKQKEQEISVGEKVTSRIEKMIGDILKEGISVTNVDLLGKAVDIHKDLANEDYWKVKKEGIKMRYRAYGEDSYGKYEDNRYGRRSRDSRGRFTARGYDTRYQGHDMMNEMYQNYENYSEGRNTYGHGEKEENMQNLKKMLVCIVDFMKMLQEDAESQEEYDLVRRYARQISEM